MAIYRLLQKVALDDCAVSAMTIAYEGVLRNLGLVDRSDPVTEIVANKIIELARTGERDPDRCARSPYVICVASRAPRST
jgi:hypothetical protein